MQAALRRTRAERDLPMNIQVLDDLHRWGVLVPLFPAGLTPVDPSRALDNTNGPPVKHVTPTVMSERMRAAGRPTDSGQDPFVPWPNERRRSPWLGCVSRGAADCCHDFVVPGAPAKVAC